MADIVISPTSISIIKKIYLGLKNPKKTFYKIKNLTRGCFRYYIKKDKTYNFVVDERITHHTIYPNGTLITDSIYTITMIDKGNFKTEKYYYSENNEKDNNLYKVDLSKMPKCKHKLDETIKENRFNDLLTIVELKSGYKNGSKFFVDKEKRSQKKYSYNIHFTNLGYFHTFSFYVSMTIPREFDRKNKKDELKIEPIYGVYKFISKIDKQSKDCYSFVPELINNGEISTPNPIENIYYHGKCWQLYCPKESNLQFKNITD